VLSERYICPILTNLDFPGRFSHVTNNKLHVNLSSGSSADTSGQTDRRTDGRTMKQKLSCAFREYANAIKNTDSH